MEEVEDIARVAVDYFDNLFSAGSCHQMEECLSTVSAKVTTDMQEMLSGDFTVDEIKEAVFQMGPTKAPGPDDDSLLFCRATQNEVEVVSEMLQTYANASGQCINLEMSSVFFSSNTSTSQKQGILRILGVQEVN